MYRPLPKTVTIRDSSIEGLGLFAKEDIPANTILGVTHVYDEQFEDNYIRTPLGGFFNHSEEPNCEAFKQDRFIILKAIKDIKKDQELTAKYWLYDINGK